MPNNVYKAFVLYVSTKLDEVLGVSFTKRKSLFKRPIFAFNVRKYLK